MRPRTSSGCCLKIGKSGLSRLGEDGRDGLFGRRRVWSLCIYVHIEWNGLAIAE